MIFVGVALRGHRPSEPEQGWLQKATLRYTDE